MKYGKLVALALVGILAFASPALATGPLVDNSIKQTNTNTNTVSPTITVSPTLKQSQDQGQLQNQSQRQDQKQDQAQGQLQGQKQNANNDGNHQDVKFEAPIIPGFAAAPGLTSVGTYACLGSISFGLSGPMAGASFGITKVDKGCEHARDAVILMQWGYPGAALKLLSMNEDTARALANDPKAQSLLKTTEAPATVKMTGTAQVPTIAPVSLSEPVAPSRDASAVSCKDREIKVRAGNGEYFCRAN